MPPASARKDGLNAQIATLTTLVGVNAVDQIDAIAKTSGAPYQAKKLTTRQAYGRLLEWQQPTPSPDLQQKVAAMSLEEVAQAALDAVALVKRAQKAGLTPKEKGVA